MPHGKQFTSKRSQTQHVPTVTLSDTKDDHTKANGGLVVVFEQALHAAKHDAWVGPEALEVGRVSGVAAHQNHRWHLHTSSTLTIYHPI